jgi:hypothetical protein
LGKKKRKKKHFPSLFLLLGKGSGILATCDEATALLDGPLGDGVGEVSTVVSVVFGKVDAGLCNGHADLGNAAHGREARHFSEDVADLAEVQMEMGIAGFELFDGSRGQLVLVDKRDRVAGQERQRDGESGQGELHLD